MAHHRAIRIAEVVEQPWWLSGSECCAVCLQRYALEAEYRCAECDAAVCPMCSVVTESYEVVCHDCRR